MGTYDPLISIIVAVRNGARTMQRCIDSFCMQTYPHTELIVLDGASEDGTVEILKTNAARIAHWESQPDRGICHAWNKGIARAVGDWILFLGADDELWAPDALATAVPFLAAAGAGTRIVYGRVARVNARGELLDIVGGPWDRVRRRFRREMTIPHQGVFHRRGLLLESGFDEGFQIAGDYELLLRELRTHDPLFMDGVVVARMRVGGISSAVGTHLASLREFRRARWKHGIRGGVAGWWWCYAKAGVRRGLGLLLGDRASRRLADGYRRFTGRPAIWTRS